jgi:hypothetical protein
LQILPRLTREGVTNHPKKDNLQGEGPVVPIISLILSHLSRQSQLDIGAFPGDPYLVDM